VDVPLVVVDPRGEEEAGRIVVEDWPVLSEIVLVGLEEQGPRGERGQRYFGAMVTSLVESSALDELERRPIFPRAGVVLSSEIDLRGVSRRRSTSRV